MGHGRPALALRRRGHHPARREAPDAVRLREPGPDPTRTGAGQPHQPVLRADVERLAARARPRPAPTGPEIHVDQAITALDPAGHLAYRGWDATRAATEARYEQVAAWLWGTTFGPNDHWSADPEGLAVGRAV